MSNVPINNQERAGLSALSTWVRHRVVGYFTGRGIIFGADAELFPRKAVAGGKFAIYGDIASTPVVSFCEDNMDTLANKMFDYVFIGRRLGVLGREPKDVLREATRKLKLGGHLVLFVPMDEVGKCANWSFTPESLEGIVAGVGSWIKKDCFVREGYILQVYKYAGDGQGVTLRKSSGKPRACVVRYGAMGDMIMVSPLIKRLHEDGYEVTLNISPYSAPIAKNNPYVSNVILQERDAIPNHTLGEYWKEWQGDYDKYINLSESIEGTMLKVEGRRDFFTSKAWREERCGRNYFDYTMERGGYPDAVGLRGELYFTREELKEAQWFRGKYAGKKMILWALNGSSFHKKYGLFQPVMKDFLDKHSDVVMVTVGDERAKEFELDHPRAIKAAAVWPIRTSLCMTQFVDVVVGPESVVTNAAGCYDTPKITLLSHSTHENLCKYWVNDFCLAPNKEIAQCYPCHQLHYNELSCPVVEIVDDDNGKVHAKGPVCAMGAIEGDRLQARLEEVLSLGISRSLEQSKA